MPKRAPRWCASDLRSAAMSAMPYARCAAPMRNSAATRRGHKTQMHSRDQATRHSPRNQRNKLSLTRNSAAAKNAARNKASPISQIETGSATNVVDPFAQLAPRQTARRSNNYRTPTHLRAMYPTQAWRSPILKTSHNVVPRCAARCPSAKMSK